MIIEKTGDLLDAFDTGEVNVIAHQANLYNSLGGGIALHIANRYPKAVEADNETAKGSLSKLGEFSIAVHDKNKFILNCYTQEGIGSSRSDPLTRNTRYDFVYNCFWKMRHRLEGVKADDFKPKLGIPFQYGSDLAGGDWNVVKAIVVSIFEPSDVPLTIYRLPDTVD